MFSNNGVTSIERYTLKGQPLTWNSKNEYKDSDDTEDSER